MKTLDKIKTIFFWLVLISLLLPAFTINNVLKFKKIEGKESIEQQTLTFGTWFSGDFQETTGEYCKLMNGFSDFFIRTFNQVDYSLFEEAHMLNGVVGQNEYLYEKNYIMAYYGQDLVEEAKIDSHLIKMKFVQDTLQKLNKQFFYVLCPGKASYYPEFLPKTDGVIKPGITNYQLLKTKMKDLGINHVDFAEYFQRDKNKFEYPIFTKTGVHWSMYAQILVMDSLNRLIEQKTNKNIPDVTWDSIKMDKANYWDADVENLMNLHFRIESPLCAYPNKRIVPKEGDELLNVLVISDSYLGGMIWDGWFKSFSEKSQFRFYNSEITLDGKTNLNSFQLPLMDQLKDKEVIILGSTDGGYKRLNWWSIDIMYEHFKYNRNTKYEEFYLSTSAQFKKDLIKNEAVLKELTLESKETNLSIDSLLTIRSFELAQKKIKFNPDISRTLH